MTETEPGVIAERGSRTHWRAGFMPLIDAAPLIVARELGFAAEAGLDLELVRETSWANIRDRMFLGHFDVAHLLAPMTVSTRLGIGHVRAPLVAPFVLSRGGNSIAITPALEAEGGDWGEPGDPVASGRAFARVVAARAARGAEPPTVAAVFPFSNHHYQLCHWLETAGVDPERDLRLVVVPPPHMVEAMASGGVDAVCVGAPWVGRAVEAGVGRLLLPTTALWPASPEKVLAMREDVARRSPDAIAGLLGALDRAAAWCEAPDNRGALARLLARSDVLDVAADGLERTLAGDLPLAPDGRRLRVDGFLRFHGATADGPINRPRVVDGLWFATQMLRRGQWRDRTEAFAEARRAFAPDLWDAVLGRPAEVGTEEVRTFSGPPFAADSSDLRLDVVDPPSRR